MIVATNQVRVLFNLNIIIPDRNIWFIHSCMQYHLRLLMYDISTELDTKPSSSGIDVGIVLSEGEQLEKMSSDPLAGDGVGNNHEKRKESTEDLVK